MPLGLRLAGQYPRVAQRHPHGTGHLRRRRGAARDLPSEVRHGAADAIAAAQAPTDEAGEGGAGAFANTLSPIEAAERQALVKAIRTTDGNMARAATLLQVSRSTLVSTLPTFGNTSSRFVT
jgi:DNA-binding NtrC family response regulator